MTINYKVAIIGLVATLHTLALLARQDGRHGGGLGSGYAHIGTNFSAPAEANRYTGGNGSGYSRTSYFFTPPVAPVSADRYGGGVGCGYAASAFNYTLPEVQPKYGGGIASGYASQSLSVMLNPLPVELVHFSARLQEDAIDLIWKTATEYQNDYFQVQKSENGEDFWEIGRVQGNGTTHIPQDYYFIDNEPITSHVYYRLKQVDYDGGYEYSPLVFVKQGLLSQLQTFPNPVAPGEIFNIVHGQIGEVDMVLLDINGQQIAFQCLQGSSDTIQVRLPDSIAPGTYIVYIRNSSLSKPIKVWVK